eukprot:Selendium_serpulae@DN3337_c0_g1_i1.p1
MSFMNRLTSLISSPKSGSGEGSEHDFEGDRAAAEDEEVREEEAQEEEGEAEKRTDEAFSTEPMTQAEVQGLNIAAVGVDKVDLEELFDAGDEARKTIVKKPLLKNEGEEGEAPQEGEEGGSPSGSRSKSSKVSFDKEQSSESEEEAKEEKKPSRGRSSSSTKSESRSKSKGKSQDEDKEPKSHPSSSSSKGPILSPAAKKEAEKRRADQNARKKRQAKEEEEEAKAAQKQKPETEKKTKEAAKLEESVATIQDSILMLAGLLQEVRDCQTSLSKKVDKLAEDAKASRRVLDNIRSDTGLTRSEMSKVSNSADRVMKERVHVPPSVEAPSRSSRRNSRPNPSKRRGKSTPKRKESNKPSSHLANFASFRPSISREMYHRLTKSYAVLDEESVDTLMTHLAKCTNSVEVVRIIKDLESSLFLDSEESEAPAAGDAEEEEDEGRTSDSETE